MFLPKVLQYVEWLPTGEDRACAASFRIEAEPSKNKRQCAAAPAASGSRREPPHRSLLYGGVRTKTHAGCHSASLHGQRICCLLEIAFTLAIVILARVVAFCELARTRAHLTQLVAHRPSWADDPCTSKRAAGLALVGCQWQWRCDGRGRCRGRALRSRLGSCGGGGGGLAAGAVAQRHAICGSQRPGDTCRAGA